MKRKDLDNKSVKCFCCGNVLGVSEQEVGLCKSCSERSVVEGFELFDAEERDKVRADEMVYV